MKLSKANKKRAIRFTFLIPLITCLATVIGIKDFADYHLTCHGSNTHEVLSIVAFVLFINVIASFSSLIAYYCLENRVNDILHKRSKDAKK